MAQQKRDKLPSNDTIEILEQILERQHVTVGKVSCKNTLSIKNIRIHSK